MPHRSLLLTCIALAASINAAAQSAVAPDSAEPGSAEDIAKATTEPRFLSPWVAYLPASSMVPSPRAFLGRIPGAPGELVDSAKAYAYSRALAAASPRVRVFTIGRSEEGRDIILLAIADEKGIQNLDAMKSANASLSGQAWGEDNLIGRPAILDMPVGNGHVVAFNFNPLYRDLNRGDQRMLWNALINWQAILTAAASPATHSEIR